MSVLGTGRTSKILYIKLSHSTFVPKFFGEMDFCITEYISRGSVAAADKV